MRFGVSGLFGLLMAAVQSSTMVQTASAGEFSYPWRSANSSIVLDAYEYTPIDWTKMSNNERLAGFINKASDGLAPKHRCGSNMLCRVKWRRYAATKELYVTRKVLAKTLGMKWGAYHLARPGNPIKQAEHFLQFTNPDDDDLLALDIEHNDPRKWMSLADAEIFAKHIKMRIGRYPFLYTNHSTSKFIAANKAKYPLLSRLNLWYARYKPSINGVFPMGHWDSYAIWQFSSMVNCNDKTCLRRINGAGNWIDVNVMAMSPEKLKREWPFAKLWSDRLHPLPKPSNEVVASGKTEGESTLLSAYAEPQSQTTRAAAAIEIAAPKMATDVTSTPTFRPGTKFLARVAVPKLRVDAIVTASVTAAPDAAYRTSDQIIASLVSRKAPVSASMLPKRTKIKIERVVVQTTPYFDPRDFPGTL